ncbi:hypothetical protein SteCoe_20676 [Stentor coeruleus]|uniref:GRAM domain-containing protein n=1 Tax=Stentor coeruleus TaxID=5963 RepID=A0A1R2BRF2_9CILI|nr:hypothetical protein SteCoe_20676 [Stentor coeruleus]
MALNPLLDHNCYPQLFPGEVITIIYLKVYGSLHLENNFRTRYPGTLFLTNARLVFVNQDLSQKQFNFALHLNLISSERLVQATPTVAFFEGRIVPYGNYLPAPGMFKFEMLQDPRPFHINICNFLSQIRRNPNQVATVNKSINTPLQPVVDNAFVDPSDPDIIYVIDQNKT